MAAVTLQNVVKSYAGHLVLDGITLDLNKGEKVGLIGANGSGKTTLFKLVIGIENPDSGTLTKSRNLTIGYLPQEPDLPYESSLLDAVSSVFDEQRKLETEIESLSHEIAESHGTPQESALLEKYDRLHARFEAGGGFSYQVRIREVLGGLGFSPHEYSQRVGTLSGGQKCRAALARLLLANAELLLLDEPTNHLDINATRWLEKYLANHEGGAVIISHDRYLLDRVVTKIIEVEDHQTNVYPTNYTHYAEAKRIRLLQAAREYEKQSTWLAHQRDYIDRARYRKDSAKQARGRQKYLDRMEADGKILSKPKGEASQIHLKFDERMSGGDMAVRCEGASKALGGVQLISNLDFEMTRGEKVGIIGPNGVGKTTLLRMLLGRLTPDSGRVRLFENLTVGYYDQEHRDLKPTLSIIDAVREIRPEASEAEARSYLALFLFRKDDVFKRVGDLSGGEQSRVLLARLVWSNPHILVLDEPTNHLDIPACEALEEALQLYPGTILMVSHDRYFLDRVVDRLLVLPERAQHEVVDGNWTVYSEILARREEMARVLEEKKRAEERAARAAVESREKKKSRSKYVGKRIEELEAEIMTTEARIKELEEAFGDPVYAKDVTKLRELDDEYNRLRPQLEELNAKWETAVEEQG